MPLLSARRAAAVALFATSTCAAIWAATVLEVHRHSTAYVMPVSVVVVAGICVALTTAGGLVAVRRPAVAPWLAPVATGVLGFGFLEAGVVVAIPFVLLALLCARTIRGATPSRQGLGAAALLTIGLVPLGVLLLLGRPVVQCSPNGVSMSAPIWTWSRSAEGSGTMNAQSGDGSSAAADHRRVEGTVTNGGTRYSYACDGSRLTRFAVAPRT